MESMSPPASVLQIEDDVALSGALALFLRGAGVASQVAACSTEALAQIDRGLQPDILLVDYNLSEEMTGTDVAEEIARRLGYVLPTIMLTADLVNAEVPWMPGAPMMLVAKPIDSTALLETIEHFTVLHRSARVRRRQFIRSANHV
jgi:CheY-like chemotaxis protein